MLNIFNGGYIFREYDTCTVRSKLSLRVGLGPAAMYHHCTNLYQKISRVCCCLCVVRVRSMSNIITNGNKLGRFFHSPVPRPPPFSVLRFAFSIIH